MAIKDIYDAILGYNLQGIGDFVKRELDLGTDVQSLLEQGLISALDEVGEKYSKGELFVPEMLMAAKTMRAGLDVLRPFLTGSSAKPAGVIVIGTVKGDLHDIGKSLVSMMLEGAGFQVVDLGIDIEPKKFIDKAKDTDADIIAMSALLTTTMPAMQQTISEIKANGIKIKTMVGGAPVTKAFADQIGADGFASDAGGAVQIARKLIQSY